MNLCRPRLVVVRVEGIPLALARHGQWEAAAVWHAEAFRLANRPARRT